MKKNQKIWLWTGLALTLLPELLWSPVMNYVYSELSPLKSGSVQILRENMLMDPHNINWLSFVLLIQFIGSVFVVGSIWRSRLSNGVNIASKVLAVILSFFSAIILLLFLMSISFRSIGF